MAICHLRGFYCVFDWTRTHQVQSFFHIISYFTVIRLIGVEQRAGGFEHFSHVHTLERRSSSWPLDPYNQSKLVFILPKARCELA